jgi:hypothetical protein
LFDKLKNGQISFNYLLDHDIIEYANFKEQHDTLIAFNELELNLDNFTHLEIENGKLLGLCAGIVPFPSIIRTTKYLPICYG